MAYTRDRAISVQFLLDFDRFRGFNPPTFSERRSFRPAARPLRPEANARQRDAPSGAKVFGRSFWRVAKTYTWPSYPAKAGYPARRGFSVKASCSGILDHPPSRVMTAS